MNLCRIKTDACEILEHGQSWKNSETSHPSEGHHFGESSSFIQRLLWRARKTIQNQSLIHRIRFDTAPLSTSKFDENWWFYRFVMILATLMNWCRIEIVPTQNCLRQEWDGTSGRDQFTLPTHDFLHRTDLDHGQATSGILFNIQWNFDWHTDT